MYDWGESSLHDLYNQGLNRVETVVLIMISLQKINFLAFIHSTFG